MLIDAEPSPPPPTVQEQAGGIRIDSLTAKVTSRRTPIRLAIACMTKRPVAMGTWLLHHRHHLGVERFYLRVEETVSLAELFARPQWSGAVRATFCDGACVRDNGTAQTERQMAHLSVAIADARATGLTHILHVDDDELIYAPNGVAALLEALSNLPAHVCSAHALTMEALVPSDQCINPFAEGGVFRHRPSEYASYGNDHSYGSTGKSFGGPCMRVHACLSNSLAKSSQELSSLPRLT